MRTISLPDMVKKVSSLVKNQSIKTFQKENQLTISIEAWDFYFTKIDNTGHYIYDECVIANRGLAEENEGLKKTLLREVICKYGITNSI
tara:strand:+ start:857 stop:1123 length:267 start_codon:yes stop_codon:yes gene_type:complete